jgi:hypothetical protein
MLAKASILRVYFKKEYQTRRMSPIGKSCASGGGEARSNMPDARLNRCPAHGAEGGAAAASR